MIARPVALMSRVAPEIGARGDQAASSVGAVIYHHPLAYLLGVEGLALLRAWAGEGEHDEPFVRRRMRRFTGCWTTPNSPRFGVSWGATRPRPHMRRGPRRTTTPTTACSPWTSPSSTRSWTGCRSATHWMRPAGRAGWRPAGEPWIRVTGIDSSDEMLEVARTRVPGASFSEGDLASLPLPDDAVDLVTTGLALTHVQDLRSVYAEFARVLRPGGSLIVSDVHPDLVLLGSTVKAIAPDGGAWLATTIGTASAITYAPLSPRVSRSALRGTPTTCTDDDRPVARADPRDRRLVDLAVDLAGLGPGGRPQRLEQPGDRRVALRTA